MIYHTSWKVTMVTKNHLLPLMERNSSWPKMVYQFSRGRNYGYPKWSTTTHGRKLWWPKMSYHPHGKELWWRQMSYHPQGNEFWLAKMIYRPSWDGIVMTKKISYHPSWEGIHRDPKWQTSCHGAELWRPKDYLPLFMGENYGDSQWAITSHGRSIYRDPKWSTPYRKKFIGIKNNLPALVGGNHYLPWIQKDTHAQSRMSFRKMSAFAKKALNVPRKIPAYWNNHLDEHTNSLN